MLSAVLVAALAAAPAPDPHPHPLFHHLRMTNVRVREVVDDIRAHSETFALLLDRLDRTDVAVYIQLVTQLRSPYFGQLHLVSGSGPLRFVRIQVRAGMSYPDLAGSLAHELRHAVEIGEHQEVRCARTLEALYRRIGEERASRGYETAAAVAAGRQVRAEMLQATRSRDIACEGSADAAAVERCAP